MSVRKTCKNVCKNSYMKEHLRIAKLHNQNKPNKSTKKLIHKDCIKRMRNPVCKGTIFEKEKINFHPDYSTEEISHLKENGALSWCAKRPTISNTFNVYNIKKDHVQQGGIKKQKAKSKKQKAKSKKQKAK